MYRKITKIFNFKLVRYGIVGLFSTTIHFSSASLFVYFFNNSLLLINIIEFSWPRRFYWGYQLPYIDQLLLLSNIFGFSLAYLFSYVAQSKLVFESNLSLIKSIKYLSVQLISLMIAILLAGQVETVGIYLKVLLVTFFLPIITFFIHKMWTFKEYKIKL